MMLMFFILSCFQYYNTRWDSKQAAAAHTRYPIFDDIQEELSIHIYKTTKPSWCWCGTIDYYPLIYVCTMGEASKYRIHRNVSKQHKQQYEEMKTHLMVIIVWRTFDKGGKRQLSVTARYGDKHFSDVCPFSYIVCKCAMRYRPMDAAFQTKYWNIYHLLSTAGRKSLNLSRTGGGGEGEKRWQQKVIGKMRFFHFGFFCFFCSFFPCFAIDDITVRSSSDDAAPLA